MLDKVEFALTSSPLSATDAEPFTLTCSITSGSVVNIAWLQNNTTKVFTQLPDSCTKQQPPTWNNISRFSESCNDTVHSLEFRFNSTTDQGGWQCGMIVNMTYMYPRSNIYNIGVASSVMSTTTRYVGTSSEPVAMTSQKGIASPVTSTQSSTTTGYRETMPKSGTVTPQRVELVLTSSPLSATDGETFTLICSGTSGSAVNIAWLQNNTTKVITQMSNNCTKQPPRVGNNNINRFSVSCNATVHSIEFCFNSATDQGGWQCGKLVNDTYIYPRSNIHSVGVASSVTSTQSSSTTARYMETTSVPGTVTPQKVVSSSVMSTLSSSTTTQYTETTSESGTVTPQTGVASPVTSTQSSSTTTRYMETTSVPGTVTPQNGELVLTSSPATATDGERFTLICSVSSGFVVNMAWLQENTTKVITQLFNGCTKQKPVVGNNISRFSVSCINTVHSIQFKFSSTRDQGGWQCGNITTDTYIHPRSSIHSIAVAIPVMSTQSLPTTTRYRETTSEPGTVTPQKGVASPDTSSQSSSTTTRYMETTSEPGTVTPQEVSTDDDDSVTIYIVVGAVCGGVLLAVVIVGIVCIRRRRQAARQKENIKGEKNVTATQVYQNAASCDMVENELYRRSRDIFPTNEAENQEDDFIMSDAYASVDMLATSTSTPREQGASCDVDVDNLYAKPDKSRSSNVQQVSDI
ncbi:mucin-5AC-like [Haliotis rubra]|uniref:mucin-5AC-like n=1 Tax=Haliotis rubra TaxID=36100 RepID=UPI001EE5C390|nr:mucin-5AC-like [Haliotis rubra]